jgi:hypothetical protein
MIEIFLKTLPFFALIALGFQACRTGFFTAEAAAYLTKFVFYFALSAMLFRFSANLSLGGDLRLVVRGGLSLGLFRRVLHRDGRGLDPAAAHGGSRGRGAMRGDRQHRLSGCARCWWCCWARRRRARS